MKLPCSVVRDLIPVYLENLTENETRDLLDAHLQECPGCRAALHAADPLPAPAVETVQPLQNLKKQIRRRRIRTAAMAALTVLAVLIALVFRAGSLQPMAWEDGLVTVQGTDTYDKRDWLGLTVYGPEYADQPLHEYTGEALFLQLSSRITGTHTETVVEEDGSETVYLQGMTYCSSSIRSDYEEYGEMVLYPVPDRVVYGFGDHQHLLWGQPQSGGVQILPRLALAGYLLIASAVLAASAFAWYLARKTRFSPLLRQLTFAPLSYLLAHLLLKGVKTVTFFLVADLMYILFTAGVLYALLSLGAQAWKQHQTE